jgi:hypothetical protein
MFRAQSYVIAYEYVLFMYSYLRIIGSLYYLL